MQFQKKNIPTSGRSLENPRGRGILETKILPEKYEAKLNFLGGGGVQKPSIGEYGYFLELHINQTCKYLALMTTN